MKIAELNALRAGDVVRLNSGGPAMVVSAYEVSHADDDPAEISVTVCWCGDHGEAYTDDFPAACLTIVLAQRNPPPPPGPESIRGRPLT